MSWDQRRWSILRGNHHGAAQLGSSVYYALASSPNVPIALDNGTELDVADVEWTPHAGVTYGLLQRYPLNPTTGPMCG